MRRDPPPEQSSIRAATLAKALLAVADAPGCVQALGEYCDEMPDWGPTRITVTARGLGIFDLLFEFAIGAPARYLYDQGVPTYSELLLQQERGIKPPEREPRVERIQRWPPECEVCGRPIPGDDVEDWTDEHDEPPTMCSDCFARWEGSGPIPRRR